MTVPTALITGTTEQGGSYLADFLLTQGYRMVGMVGQASSRGCEWIEHLRGKMGLHKLEGRCSTTK